MYLCEAPAPSPQILQLGWHQAEEFSNGDQRLSTLYLEYAKYFTLLYIYIYYYYYFVTSTNYTSIVSTPVPPRCEMKPRKGSQK